MSMTQDVAFFRVVQLRAALKLEIYGMKHSSGRAVAPVIRKEYGFKSRSKQDLLGDFEAFIQAVKDGTFIWTGEAWEHKSVLEYWV